MKIDELTITVTIKGTCATCKHMEPLGAADRSAELYFWGYGSRDGKPIGMTGAEEAGVCGFCVAVERRVDDGPVTGAVALTDDSRQAALVVTPDFGCVMWEGK
jgi:hypothetical protein